MGALPPPNMKVILSLSCLLAAAAAMDTCSNCKAVVTASANYLKSTESMASQKTILSGAICGAGDTVTCKANFDTYWGGIGSRLWPGYFNTTADWTCGTRCEAPTEETMDCDSCVTGVKISVDQLLTDYFLDTIVTGLGGDWYCASQEDTRCPEFVDTVIRQGLPILLTESDIGSRFPALCNMGVEGTCPARRLRLI